MKKYIGVIGLLLANWCCGVWAQTEFSPDIWADRIEMALSSGGGISGDVSGSFSIAASDLVEAQVYDAEEAEWFELAFRPNASKDLLVSMMEFAPEGNYPQTEFIYLTMIKKPTVLVQADLAGDWRFVQLLVERQEGFSAVFPEVESFALTVETNGTFNIGVPGTVNVTSNRQVLVALPDETLVFDINASKSVMVNMEENVDGDHLIRYLLRPAPLASLDAVQGDWLAQSLFIESVNERDYNLFEIENTRVTLQTNGTFQTDDGEAGTLGIYTGFDLQLQEASEPVADVFRLNSARDFAVMAQAFETNQFHDLALLTKGPAALSVADLAGEWALYDFSVEHIQNASLLTNTYYYSDEITEVQNYSAYYTNGYEIRHGFYEENYSNGVPAIRATYIDNEREGAYQAWSIDGDLTEDHVFNRGTNVSLRNLSYYGAGLTNSIVEEDYSPSEELLAQRTYTYREDQRPLSSTRMEYGSGSLVQWSTNWNYRVDGTLEQWYASYYDSQSSSAFWRDYHEDGISLAAIHQTTNGLYHDAHEQFSTNGVRTQLITYSFGDRHGLHEEVTEAGIKTLQEYYHYDRLHGIRREWTPGGTLIEDGYYHLGRQHNDLYRYDETSGLITSHQQFEYGILTYSKYYSYYGNGALNLTHERTVDLAGDHTEDRYWLETGEPSSVSRSVGGVLHGEQLDYWPDGTLRERSVYVMGRLAGNWSSNFENGQLWQEGSYTNNQKTGIWKTYTDGGTLVNEETFASGQLEGSVKRWRDDGMILEESTYVRGFEQSEKVYYYYYYEGSGESTDLQLTYLTTYEGSSKRVVTRSYYESGLPQYVNTRLNGEYDGLQEGWYENGQRSGASYFKNGLDHGTSESWSEAGHPISESTYQHGKLHGEQVLYWENSDQIKTYEQYVAGRQSGLQLTFAENGVLLARYNMLDDEYDGRYEAFRTAGTKYQDINYSKGILDGRYRTYHADGTTVSEDKTYVDGLVHGVVKTYDDTGFQTSFYTVEDGILNGPAKQFFSGGQRYEYTNVDGLKHGNYEYYDSPSHLHSRTPYVHGIIHGTVQQWHPSTTKTFWTQVYVDGIKEGAYRQYYLSGALNISGQYTLGVKHGTWTTKYETGGTSSTQVYSYGERHGAYRYYDTIGVLRTRGQYSGNSRSGTWTYYNSDGVVSDTESFGSGGDTPEAPEESDPVVYGQVIFKLTNADTGDPVSGTVYWIENSSGITNAAYVGKNGAQGAGVTISNTVSISAFATVPGFAPATASGSVSLTKTAEVIELNLNPFAGPIITRATSRNGDHFMHGVDFYCAYDVEVNWQQLTEGSLRYTINGQGDFSGSQDQINVRMGSGLFAPSASQAGNTIEVVAVSAEGVESKPFKINPVVYPQPQWIPGAVGVFTAQNYPDGYALALDVPQSPFEASFEPGDLPEELQTLWSTVPYVGGFGFGLLPTQVGMSVFISTKGSGSADAYGKSGFKAAGAQITADLQGEGTLGFNYSFGGGCVFEAIDLQAELDTKIERSQGLLELFPSLKNVKDTYPVFGELVEVVANAAELKVGLSLKGNTDITLSENSQTKALDYTEASGTVTAGVELGLTLQNDTTAATLSGQGNVVYGWTSPPGQNTFDYTLDGNGLFALNIAWRNIDIFSENLVVWGDNQSLAPLSLNIVPMQTAFISEPNYNLIVEGASDSVVENIFPRANPKLIASDQAHGVIYVSMDAADPVAQGSEINFVYHDGTNYLAPTVIENNSVGDFAPDAVFLDEGRVLAVWEQINKPSLDGLDLELFAAALDIVWSVYTPASQSWSTPVALTSNTNLDMNVKLLQDGTNTMVLWESNEQNALLSSSNAPSILYTADWNGSGFDAAEAIPYPLQGGYDLDAIAHDDQIRIVYVQDGDSDYATSGDKDLYLLDWNIDEFEEWSEPFQLTISGTDESSPRLAATDYGLELFWVRDGALVQVQDDSLGTFTELVSAEELGVFSSLAVQGVSSNLWVSWVGNNNGQPDVAFRYYEHGWNTSHTHFLTENDQIENSISGALLPNGSLALSFTSAGSNQVDLQVIEFEPGVDVKAGALDIDQPAVPGEYLNVTAEIINAGILDPGNVKVLYYEVGGSVLFTNTVYFNHAGVYIDNFYYPVPETTNQVELGFTIDPFNEVPELNESNNVTTISLFSPNLRMVDLDVLSVSGSVYQAQAVVENNGTLGALETQIVFDVGNGVMQSLAVAPLLAGTSGVYAVEFHETDLFSNGVANLTVTVDPADAIDESNERDNVFGLTMDRPVPPFADTDFDDLDDYWEMLYFTNLLQNGSLDSDGDGMSDRAEYFGGTNPRDAASALWIGLDVGATDNLLEWNTQPGVTYRLEYTTNLTSGSWFPIGGDRPTGGYTESTDSQLDLEVDSPKRFYRVRVVEP